MTRRSRTLFSALGALLLGASASAALAQNSATLVPAHASLLPPAFGAWKADASAQAPTAEPAMSLVNANHAALQEANPQRSEVTSFVGPGGRVMRVEAVQFGDFSGAWSAYTLVRKPGLKDEKSLGASDAVGENAILFQQGATVVVAYPVTRADVEALKPLAGSLPAVRGSAAQPPLLPTYLPTKSLVDGSVRYALGAATYSGEGGVLPSAGLGWEKSGEAVTATYKDKRGEETLTLFFYPTPQIATASLKHVQAVLPGLGPKFETAKVKREALLVVLASGTFSPAAAQAMIDGVHMKQIASTERGNPPPEFHSEVRKTASLLANIMILSGVLCAAAVLLGLFLGGGRAAIRVLRGKPAAAEVEFLSLHLDPQNAPASFAQEKSVERPENPEETR
ncbi:DUF6599 family protein [Granulicella cerasi]|uniref:DUF6599 family protein n=1 Tax=Granulicella cerasi TaxID=741063 RepID=UPI0021DF41F6|nr:DUF6599 family protein [Granulicella cerasi]